MKKVNMMRMACLFLLFFAGMAAACARGLGYDLRKGYGEDYTAPDGSLVTHAVQREFPMEGEPLYNVRVNGAYVGLYNDRNKRGALVHFGSFEFLNGHLMTIQISYHEAIRTYEILPERELNLIKVEQTSKNSICITLSEANQNITLVVNGELQREVLHLFCNSIDQNRPNVPDRTGYHCYKEQKLHYFGPGHYDLKALTGDSRLMIEDGWKVYLDAGAVVSGQMAMFGTSKGTKLHGRGMLYTTERKLVFEANRSTGGDIEGILLHGHRESCWQVAVTLTQNFETHDVKILSVRYASTDGLDVVCSQYCIFVNTFIRANDDAVAIKGIKDGPPCSHLTFCKMQLWNDCNTGFGIGAGNETSLYEDIRLLNSQILYSYDDPDYHEVLDERAALTICCLNGAYYRQILFENIDVYHCERLVALGFQPTFWFGAIKGDQTRPGGISDVTFRNVSSPNNSGSKIANKLRLYGWKRDDGTPEKWTEKVRFWNVTLEGRKLQSTNDAAFSETEWERVREVSVE